MNEAQHRPLCVDLDGTLIRSDVLLESLLALVKKNPLYLFALPLWLLGGRAAFKDRVARAVDLDATLLPYSAAVVQFLRRQRDRGRTIVLATASNARPARAIAAHVGVFDGVFASDASTNLKGRRKLDLLLERYGEHGFDYAGDSPADLVIWRHAAESIVVNASPAVRRAASRLGRAPRELRDDGVGTLRAYASALRLHQWIKNLLIFMPLLLAHRIAEPALAIDATLGFLAFSLCASGVYMLNDLFDLPSDRQHAAKRHRPFAAGHLPISYGLVLAPILTAGAFATAMLLPLEFVGMLGLYLVTTLAYSLRLKQVVMVDVLTLAGLYTLRIVAGGAAVSITPSFWLLAFSMFLFLSLALAKRYMELLHLQTRKMRAAPGRGYRAHDLVILAQFGTSSAYIAVLVLALYINSETILRLYHHPQLLWLLCPLALYLVSRIWLLAQRGRLHEDPVIFAITDRRSQVLVVVGAALLWLAT